MCLVHVDLKKTMAVLLENMMDRLERVERRLDEVQNGSMGGKPLGLGHHAPDERWDGSRVNHALGNNTPKTQGEVGGGDSKAKDSKPVEAKGGLMNLGIKEVSMMMTNSQEILFVVFFMITIRN